MQGKSRLRHIVCSFRQTARLITEAGIVRLVERFIEIGQRDARFADCQVDFRSVRGDGQSCALIEIRHRTSTPDFKFHFARIYIDTQLEVPIGYETYLWPMDANSAPELLEVYTYQNVRLNNGFTDRAFDVENPEYNF